MASELIAHQNHYSDAIMNAMASQINGVLFAQPFVQVQIKENVKAPRHWPLWRESTTVTGGFPSQRVNNAENVSIWWRHHDISLCKPQRHEL